LFSCEQIPQIFGVPDVEKGSQPLTIFQPAVLKVEKLFSSVVVFPVAPATGLPLGIVVVGPKVMSQKEFETVGDTSLPPIPWLAPGVTV
jgi:hypothetical protein